MFNVYTQQLAGLYRVKGLPRQAADILFKTLARCDGTLDFNGTLIVDRLETRVPLPSASGANFALANATWVRASGHNSTVTAVPADDPIGTPTSGASPITIKLPRSCGAKDPNVYSGDVLQYVTVNGVNYAVGASYLDEPIGTTKLYTNGDIRNGWHLMDDAAYGHDMEDFFPMGTKVLGDLLTDGGGDDHYHDVRDTSYLVDQAHDGGATDYEIFGATACPSGPKLRDADGNCQNAAADIRGPWVKFYYLIRIAPNGDIA